MVREGILTCEETGGGVVGFVVAGSSQLMSWECLVPGCSSPAVARVEVVGAVVDRDSRVVVAGRHCVVVVGIGGVVAVETVKQGPDRSQT